MKDIEREQSLIRQYLLGDLEEEQREQLEQRVITNPDYKEEVLITEEELLEDFVNGRLSPREQELCRARYASTPSSRRKVEIARALSKYAAEHAMEPQPALPQRRWVRSFFELFSTKNRFRQLSLAILILIVAGGAFLLYWWLSRESRANYQHLVQLNGPTSEVMQPDQSVEAISLSSLLLRGAGDPRIVTITNQTKTVQLRLADPSRGKANIFRARLKDSAGGEVFTLNDVPSRQSGQFSMLVIQIPAEMLTTQDYQLEVSGRKPDGTYDDPATYSFRVQKSQ